MFHSRNKGSVPYGNQSSASTGYQDFRTSENEYAEYSDEYGNDSYDLDDEDDDYSDYE